MQIEYASEAGVPFLQKKCGLLNLGAWKPVGGGVRWQWDNTYTTTIHAVNSVGALCPLRFCTHPLSLRPPPRLPAPSVLLAAAAPLPSASSGGPCSPLCCGTVVKMSRLSKIKPLYRGWTDATLPKSFFEADGMGVKGGVEYGFSSTTTDRAQAAHYAQGKASTILELEMGMVDRGADIGARLPPLPSRPTRFLPSRASPRIPLRLALTPPLASAFPPSQTGSRSTPTRRRRCCRR